MSRVYWRAANLLNPVPAVLITCADGEGRENVMTVAWAGTVCSDPVMVSISVRKSRYSHELIKNSGEFAINLVNRKLCKATDFVGVRSGRDLDKFALEGDLKLTKETAKIIKAPIIKESPLVLECKVKQILELGSHDMFVAEVVSTDVNDEFLDETGRLDLGKADLVAYSHGEYYSLGNKLGKFGYSVRKKIEEPSKPQRKPRKKNVNSQNRDHKKTERKQSKKK